MRDLAACTYDKNGFFIIIFLIAHLWIKLEKITRKEKKIKYPFTYKENNNKLK
jgi:hypothetical protein